MTTNNQNKFQFQLFGEGSGEVGAGIGIVLTGTIAMQWRMSAGRACGIVRRAAIPPTGAYLRVRCDAHLRFTAPRRGNGR